MLIEKPEIRKQGKNIVLSVPVDSSTGKSALWFSLDVKYADFVIDAGDAPLTSLLIPAMATGEDIHVTAPISERLNYFLSNPYQVLLQRIFPKLRRVNIYPADLHKRTERAPGVGASFSGGIDSFSLLADHHYADVVPSGFKVSHLLFNNVGSHLQEKKGTQLFHARMENMRFLAERVGLPLLIIDSNMDSFYPRGFNYIQTLSHRNAAIPLLLQGGIGRCLIASSYSYDHVFIGPDKNMSNSDLITFSMLSTEVLDMLSVGSQYTRIEKTLRVAEILDSYDTLDVCYRQRKDGNCSECPKCIRTLLTLEIAGLMERYSTSFDLETYRRVRNKRLRKLLGRYDPLLHELIPYAKQRKLPLPYYLKIIALLSELVYRLKRMVKHTVP
jgi:hypothetical protein